MSSKKYSCPACSRPNFSFDNVKLTGQCFSCGHKAGGLHTLKQLGETQGCYIPRMKFAAPELREPKGEGLEYLHSRGIKGTIIQSVGIKWDGEQLYLPIWSPINNTKSWIRRKPRGSINYSDGMPGVPYVLGAWGIKNYLSCTLVEGPFSLLSPGLWGKGFSLLGSILDPRLEKWLRLREFEQIVVWFDGDDVGFAKATAIYQRLTRWHPNVLVTNGWLWDSGRDPGDYTPTEAGFLLSEVRRTGMRCPPKPPDLSRRLLQLGIKLGKVSQK